MIADCFYYVPKKIRVSAQIWAKYFRKTCENEFILEHNLNIQILINRKTEYFNITF